MPRKLYSFRGKIYLKEVFYIKTLYFQDIENLANSILEKYDQYSETNKDFMSIGVIAHYQIMADLINYLVKNTSFAIKNVEIKEPCSDNYFDEWILTLDDEKMLWCEKAVRPKNQFNDGGYIYCDDDITFVHNDVNSKFVARNKNANLVAFELCDYTNDDYLEDDFDDFDDDYDDEPCTCDKCSEVKKSEDNGDFKITINGKPATKEEVKEAIDNLTKYLLHMNDMMREMNSFARLFNW